MKGFQVPATLEGVSLLKDGGVSLRFHTNEMSASDKTAISNWYQQFGWLLFNAQEQDTDSLILDNIRKDTGGKTPSQRLRGALYVAYEQSGQKDKTFEQFYAEKMERFIQHIKSQLD